MIEENYRLAERSWFKVGGSSRFFVEIKSKGDFYNLCQELEEYEPVDKYVFGACSNLVISDKGFNGLVIKNSIDFVEYIDDLWHIGGGTLLPVAARKLIQNGYAGLEKIGNVPGTVGGAIYGNVEAHHQSISDYIYEVEWCDFAGSCTIFTKEDCNFSYRSSKFKTDYFQSGMILGARFTFPQGESEALFQELSADKERRKTSYPQLPSCGCFFKNIELDNKSLEKIANALGKDIVRDRKVGDMFSVGLLLDRLSMKGLKIGGAEVSHEHANFIVNAGGATAQDVYDLYRKIKHDVKERVGIDLVNEVQFCGEFEERDIE